MRKVTCVVLFVIVFETCAISNLAGAKRGTGERNVKAEEHQIQQPMVVGLLEEYPDEYTNEESDVSGLPVGSWRSTGKALEPKWRDGDSVPLVPFHTVTISSKSPLRKKPNPDLVDSGKSFISGQRSSHWQSHRQEKGTVITDDYNYKTSEKPDQKINHQVFRGREIRLSRRRKPPQFEDEVRHQTTENYFNEAQDFYENPRENKPMIGNQRENKPIIINQKENKPINNNNNNNQKENKLVTDTQNENKLITGTRKENKQVAGNQKENTQIAGNQKENKPVIRTPKLPYNNNEYLEGVALRYRETFQNYPSEYELNEEEYQRPRSRKRRPPQNDEFVELKTSPISFTDRNPTLSTRSQRKQENSRRNNFIRTNHNRSSKTSEKPTENSELKSLLKMQQVEGLSLSEILQRRNLTLSDLLQGKADVINLLKSKQVEDELEEELNSKTMEMMKISASSSLRVPPREIHRQTNPVDSTFRATSTHSFQKVLPTQEVHKRIHPTESMSPIKLLNPVKLINPIKSANITKSFNLFKSLNVTKPVNLIKLPDPTKLTNPVKLINPPKLINSSLENPINTTESVEEKPKVHDEDEIMEFSDFNVKKENSKSANISETKEFDNTNEDSESTLSIEHLLSPTMQPNESQENMDEFLEQSRERIQLENKIPHSEQEDENTSKEVSSFELEYQNDGPQSKESTTEREVDNSEEENLDSLNNHKAILNHKNEDIYLEMEPDARAEILELFNSGTSAKKLEGLLKARNMSIEDLIALRQRGSSQLHLAEVAHSRENNIRVSSQKDPQDKKPLKVKLLKPDCPPSREIEEFIEWMQEKELKKEPVKDILHIKEFETLPPIWTDQFGKSHFFAPKTENAPDSRNLETEDKNAENVNLEADKNLNLETEDAETVDNSEKPKSEYASDDFMDILSHFKTSQSFNKDDESSRGISFYTNNDQVPSSNLPERKNNSVIPVEDGRVQEIVSDISNTFNNIFRLNADEGKREEKNSISRIRTSIIVSGAILGVTIVVFLSIFIVCRVRQKKKYTYSNTFSRAVFQSPVLAGRKLSNTSSLNTIMVNVVATSTTKRPEKPGCPETDDDYDIKSDIEHDSLDANDSWETIPDFMK